MQHKQFLVQCLQWRHWLEERVLYLICGKCICWINVSVSIAKRREKVSVYVINYINLTLVTFVLNKRYSESCDRSKE